MKRCILITGTGRSGTSMTAGLLHRAGVVMSDDMIEASAQNPRGSFEDRRIQDLQREMLSKLGPLSVPPPEGWLKKPEIAKSSAQLSEVVTEGLKIAGDAPWGFKDPHSAYTIPLWTRIFNQHKITPSIFLCVRDPSAVVTSLIRQYDFDPAVAEVFWLTKNLHAILDTGADIFVVHYERLVTGDKKLLSQIVEYAHIPEPAPLKEVAALIDPKLNRSATNSQRINNPSVKQLWAALENCHGANFDRNSLMRVAYEVKAEMAHWSGWMHEIYRIHQSSLTNATAKPNLPSDIKKKESNEILALNMADSEHTGTYTQEEAQTTITNQLRALEIAREQTQTAAEEINRLRTFAQSLKRDEANVKTDARKAADQLRAKCNRQQAQLDELQNECNRLKDEIMALHGSTTQRVGRQLRAIKSAPLRESLRLPGKIRRVLRAQRSKQREGLR